MDLLLKVAIFIFLVSSLQAYEETFENSTNLCQRCRCITGPQFVLDCQSQNFHHTIANWPEHNTSLIATFSYNNISNLEILPDSDLVTELIFDHCGIKSLDNGVFKTVKYVKFIDLSYNSLTTEEISPEKFKGPYNDSVYEPLLITHLDLSYNKIHSLPHKIFEHLVTLRELNLEGNKFKVLDPPTQMALSGLRNLEVLNLANNDLTELVGDSVKNLQTLKVLNLAYNKLDYVPDTLSLLGESLDTVYLEHNLIYKLTDESFLGVKGISELSLINLPRLQYVNANTFAPLKNLKILYLSDNPSLSLIDREAFGVNQTLEELYIHNNSLRELHYNLTKWSALRILTLTGNEFDCDCDLYNIAQDLSEDIRRDKDGPLCINPMNDRSLMIYSLTSEVCDFQKNTLKVSHIINRHFHIIRAILLVTSLVLCLTTLIAVAVGFLKYRRYRMNRNYPFTTQVLYNPLRSPFVN